MLTHAMQTFAAATGDYPQLLDVIARHVAEVIGDSCVLLVLDETETRLVPAAAHADEASLDRIHTLLRSEPIFLDVHPTAKKVIESREPLLLPRIDPTQLPVETTSAYAAFLREQKIHSLLLVALQAHGKAIGLFTLTRHRTTSTAFDEDDRTLATSLADLASLTIANARLYAAEQRARIAAEEAARERRQAELRFATLSDAGVIGIVVARIDGSIVDVNPYVERLLGYTRAELVAGAWPRAQTGEWTQADSAALEQLRASGVSSLREKEYLRKDGTRVSVLLAAALVGRGPEIIAFLLDLTEPKKIEAALARLRAERTADARFRVVLEAAPDAIVITDAAERITIVNGAAERLFGYERTELVERPITQLLPDLASSALYGRRKSGSLFLTELTLSTLDTDEGPLTVRAIRDVTDRKRAELDVVLAKEAAESAHRELETFSYSVAHDLRGPLRAMNGFAQILHSDYAEGMPADGRTLLERISVNASRMAELIDGLLGLARLARTQPRREPIDLSALVRSSIAQALADPAARARAGTTEVIVPDGLTADGDPILVRSLVDNLTTNAVKFTAEETAARIELGVVERDGSPAFFLRDNGAGFDMTFSGKLFLPFQRLHAARVFEGTGIGLATAQRIVLAHGGRIWAEASVGEGATFFFTLSPAIPPHAARKPMPDRTPST